RHLIELTDRLFFVVVPGQAAVETDIQPAIVTDRDHARVLRADKDRVIVAVTRALHAAPRLAAVGRHLRGCAALEELVRIRWMDADLAVIDRPIVDVGQERPRLTRIVRAPHAALVRAAVLRALHVAAGAGPTIIGNADLDAGFSAP